MLEYPHHMRILEYPHHMLRYRTRKPKEDLNWLAKIACSMLMTMREVGGLGLSANQVGLPWRMFVSEFGIFLNPTILNPCGSVTLEEGCLSLPKRWELVERAEEVTLDAFELILPDPDDSQPIIQLEPVQRKLSGLEARIPQHEVDHLNGILFIDYGR